MTRRLRTKTPRRPSRAWITKARALVPLVDVPVTIAGVSSHNVMNAMQAASAALAIELPERGVVKGLRTFVLDAERNPGRANLFELEGRIVVLDYAHNAAGMMAGRALPGTLPARGRGVARDLHGG